MVAETQSLAQSAPPSSGQKSAAIPHHASDMQAVLQGRAHEVDSTLGRLWASYHFPSSMALIAVGGYGRQELFPHSDIDVMVLLDEHEREQLSKASLSSLQHDNSLASRIAQFLSACWDCGLEIGSSVRTLSECLEQARADVTIQTTLLESRCIAGNGALLSSLHERYFQELDVLGFCRAKMVEMRQRHLKYDDTPYALEPNCKESPGGLRDLHMVLWLAKAMRVMAQNEGWEALAKDRGAHPPLATAREAEQLAQNCNKLWRIRYALHILAKRREDRLVFDLQPAVAQLLGYLGDAQTDNKESTNPRLASEALMKDYYWTAKAVSQLSLILLQNIQDSWSDQPSSKVPIVDCPDVEPGLFFDKAGLIDVGDVDVFQRQPLAVLQTFLLYVRQSGMRGLATTTLRALYQARDHMDATWREHPRNRQLFMAILQSPQGTTHVLRLMNETSVLGRYLWDFRRIVGQMQHDLFHVYTVDQHILRVVRNMRRFFIADHAHEYPLCSQIASGWKKPWLLHIAALYHDIGKGQGGDHSQIGADLALRFCQKHDLDEAESALIVFLVREHLTMSQVAQKEDLSDPEVIAKFARRIGTLTRLNALYLLTVADIRGTSPKVWTAWKANLLEALYHKASQLLSQPTGQHNDQPTHLAMEYEPQAQIEQRKSEALRLLALQAQPPLSYQPIWDTLGISYFMRHEAQDIAWHTKHLSRFFHLQRKTSQEAARSAESTDSISPPLVIARPSPVGEGLQVFVYSVDQPDLFARICGFFEQQRYSILDAKIHTTLNGYALDTFQVISPDPLQQYRDWMALIENGLRLNIAEQSPLMAPASSRLSRRVKSFPIPPSVSLKPDDNAQHWILSISSSDRLGLLYRVALVLASYKIELLLAKISTLGERVEDTLLIRGEALQSNHSQAQFELAVLRALQQDN